MAATTPDLARQLEAGFDAGPEHARQLLGRLYADTVELKHVPPLASDGAVDGKRLAESTDREAAAIGLVEAQLGDGIDDQYRLWFIDNAMHTTPIVMPTDPRPVRTTRTVSYLGVLQQALRDVSDWVERGVAPPPSTVYEIADGQVVLPASAKERRGVQPVVSLTVGGGDMVEVSVGETVEFVGAAEVPTKAGNIVRAQWDFEGAGDFPVEQPVYGGADGPLSAVTVSASHTFSEPGTYFPVLRVTSQREGDARTLYGHVYNLARVRVVVR